MDHKKLYEDGILDTTSGNVPKSFESPAPDPEIGANGQHKDYWVLSEAERSKGLVRPVRTSYKHVGTPSPRYPLRDLTEEEREIYNGLGWIKFETYPDDGNCSGRFWTQAELDNANKGCGCVTKMGRALAETYARNPHFYGVTFCVECGVHLEVGEFGEFIWDDGSGERVGT